MCKDCKYYKETYTGKGYCRFWDNYVLDNDSCDDIDEK